MISLVVLLALVAPAVCDIAFNGGDAQWNNGAATGNTIEITSPLTYTITASGNWRIFVFDEAVTTDGSGTSVGCTGLQVSDCFIKMQSLTFRLQYTIGGTSASTSSVFVDNGAVASDLSANDGYISFNPSIAVTAGQTIVIPAQTITCGGAAGFNPQYNSLVFTGNTFLTDGSGNKISGSCFFFQLIIFNILPII